MTVALFTNFGSGASYSLVGDERLAALTITTGYSPDQGVLRFAYSNGFLLANPQALVLPLDAATAALSLDNSGGYGFGEFSFVISNLAPNTTYRWALRIG